MKERCCEDENAIRRLVYIDQRLPHSFPVVFCLLNLNQNILLTLRRIFLPNPRLFITIALFPNKKKRVNDEFSLLRQYKQNDYMTMLNAHKLAKETVEPHHSEF